MGRTTIEVPERIRDKLKEARLMHETSYAQTIERLLGESGGRAWTREEIKAIAKEVVEEHD